MRKAKFEGRFNTHHVAGYKMVVEHASSSSDMNGFYSLDTGNDENIFAGHYFDMNRNHLDGKLHPMLNGDQLDQVKSSTLHLTPESFRPTSNKEKGQTDL